MRDVSSWAAPSSVRSRPCFMSRDNDVLRVVGPAPMGGDFVEIVIDDGAAAAGHAAVLRQRPAAVADHLRDHRGAGLFRAALPARAADAAHHRQHDGVPRRPGKSVAHDRAVGAARTRSASPSASSPSMQQRPRLDAASEEPACGARPCGVEDQPRSAQPAGLGAACSRTGCRSLPDPRVQRFAPKLMRALERAIEFCQSTLSYGRAQEPPPDRKLVAARAAGRGGARDARARRREHRSAGSSRSSAA